MMKRFNPNTVRSSSHLAKTPEATRRYEASVYKAAIERSEGKEVVKVREYLAPIKAGYVPTGFGRKRHPLKSKLSHAKRQMVLAKASANLEFHQALRAECGLPPL